MSKAKLRPEGTFSQGENLFREPETIEFPRVGKAICIPASGISVISRDDAVCIVSFLPDEKDGRGKLAVVTGISPEHAHVIGAQLIAAAHAIGGDRGLQ